MSKHFSNPLHRTLLTKTSMAAKRTNEAAFNQVPEKKPKAQENDRRLQTFLEWCKTGNLILNPKVKVGKEGSCSNYGMIAVEDISESEVLFEIPRSILLDERTTTIHELMKQEMASLESGSGWVPVLISLMYEFNNPSSKWRPYLDLVPEEDDLDLPMFWNKSDMENELRGTGVPEMVKKDRGFIEREFNNIVLPFVKKHPGHFPPICQDIEFYKKMVAFVMAYSFTEPEKSDDNEDEEEDGEIDSKTTPFMVPMADILNHVAKNNAHLDFGKDALKMVAVKPIRKGEEVFNTYGELSNAQLLQMYGFSEAYPNNHYDTVDISLTVMRDTMLRDPPEGNLKLAKEKWNYMEDSGRISTEGGIVVGGDGVLTDDDLRAVLKVIFLSKSEFDDYKQNDDGWSDEEEDNEATLSFQFDKMHKLPATWKTFLRSICEACVKQYNTTLDQLENQLDSPNMTRRQRYCKYLKHGQLKIFQKFMSSLG